MRTYLIRRLLLLVPTVVGLSLVAFALMRALPGDPAYAIASAGGEAVPRPEDIARVRRELGLERPIYAQYWAFLTELAGGNLGKSFKSGRPVLQEIQDRLPVTVQLGIMGVLAGVTVSIPVGVLAAIKQDSWLDYIVRGATILWISMPVFWTATIIILVLVVFFDWFPPLGFAGFFENPETNLSQIIWPVIALGLALTGPMARMVRSAVLETLRQDYVRTAKSKGLREQLVIVRHVLPNALLPVVTLLGLQLALVVSGAVILEKIFLLPGIGSYLVAAVTDRDYPVVQGLLVFIAVFVVLLNLVVDLSYSLLDPRVAYK